MYFLLFERPPHLAGQFVEKLAHGAVVKIAGVLRKNLASEDGDRLAMAGGRTFGIGIDDFAAGEHTGQKRLASRRPFRHPAVRRPYGLFQIVDAPRRPIAGSQPKRDLEFAPRPLRSGQEAKGFHNRPLFAIDQVRIGRRRDVLFTTAIKRTHRRQVIHDCAEPGFGFRFQAAVSSRGNKVALALGAVAADFAIKYLCTERADHLVGLVVFTILTARMLLLLCFETIEAEVFRRRLTCAVAFFACAVASVASELAATGSLALVTLLPLVGIGMGCLGEASNAMVVRRRCVLAMGCIMALFAISTGAWGLVFKNTISDVGASIWSMIKYRDPPLPALASVIGFRLTITPTR